MTSRKPSKKAANEAWETLRELLAEFPTPRKRTWVQDKYEWDTQRPQRPTMPASFVPHHSEEYRKAMWQHEESKPSWQSGRHSLWQQYDKDVAAWRGSGRLIKKAHAEYGTRRPDWLLAPLLTAVGRDQFEEIPLFAVSQTVPEEGSHIGAGCSLYTECVSIIVQDCEPLVWRPRPRTQFDRDLDRMLIDQETLEVRDNQIVVIDRPDANQINLLATTWRDPNYQHQPYWRKGVITLSAAELKMHHRTFFITGRNLTPQIEKYDAGHRMYTTYLEWDDGPTSYTRTRKALKEWVLAERDRFYDASLVMVKDGWLQRNVKWEW